MRLLSLIKLLQQRFDNSTFTTDPGDFGPFLQKSSLPKTQQQSIEVSLGSSVWRIGVALYHRDRDDSVSGVGEVDMSKDPSGQQWVGTEADLLPNPKWTIIFDRGFNRRKVFEGRTSYLVSRQVQCGLLSVTHGLQATQTRTPKDIR